MSNGLWATNEEVKCLAKKIRSLSCKVNSSPSASASTDSQSKYLLTEDPDTSTFSIDGAKLRDINDKNLVPMFQAPVGNLTNGLVPVTKAGAMSSATITATALYDKVVVGGSSEASYFQFPFIMTVNKAIYRLKIKVEALGATAPLVGFRNIWPGGTYSNYNNQQFHCYVNLLTGAITTITTDVTTLNTYNGWSGAAVVGDIIEVEIKFEYGAQRIITATKTGLTTEISTKRQQHATNTIGDWALLTQPAVILADGTYTIFDYQIFSLQNEPLVLFDGDSMASGATLTFPDTIVGRLKSKMPYRTASIAAGTKLLTGHLSTLWEVERLRPKYVVLVHYLESVQGYANPANGNYATWSANFTKYVSTLDALGITPIFVYPESWAILDPSGTNAAYYETYLNTNYPSFMKVKVTNANATYDTTGFHYSAATNDWIAEQILALIDPSL